MVLSLHKFFITVEYNLNGPVVIALGNKSDAQSSNHTRILKKISLPLISLVFIDSYIY